MTNKELANAFREVGQLMELHGENAFRTRSYANAYITLRKHGQPLADMSVEELGAIKGVGSAIAQKIRQLVDTGTMDALEKYRAITPEGVRDMLDISGFGPKKVLVVWKELGIESVGELLYAVNENRLLELKGFGPKTQEELKKQLAYHQLSKGQYLYAKLEPIALDIVQRAKAAFPAIQIDFTGSLRRASPVLEGISLLVAGVEPAELANKLALAASNGHFQTEAGIPVHLYACQPEEWGSKWFRYSAGEAFLEAFLEAFPEQDFRNQPNEAAIFQMVKLPFVEPEMREDDYALQLARDGKLSTLVQETDIKGVIHTHTTYSDGIHSLEEMARHAQSLGYQYIAISDHSKSAFYANGLKPERVLAQMDEIDQINARLQNFRILKSIESDILADGSLDYEEEVLKRFDLVIASVHSNLRMDEAKATQRLISAIENPYTHILGHPTGRLLLSRAGYPLDHQKIIDACAANNVAIELNANPYRLDLDWTWIPYAMEKGVFIAINPDAHSKEGISDIRYGVLAARKGGLTAKACLNTLTIEEVLQWKARK